ncbi:tRNA (N6-threonylcarbamoyladenosine(37)-N6)-methyltransferase TrmO [Thiomicrorhabdus sediminis]|uniref:tRNA (N6-threonylcarbamoyladenosine(37)-N6)-methyltransferase TrmO n=2 Tax=Thiomicrorhabdus sediminis TaxID=2580412 RepID=A0A4P9K4Z8_9GAMM|nr:tRNA (N6-threonylcarbamoyladenosine(37)-N6)-methyltransferase TrmO [Thiomicrorhabdus sediminis]
MDTTHLNEFSIHTIGYLHSPFKDKFAVPRQPGLIEGDLGEIELLPPWNRIEALQGLDGFSHIWVMFIFHQAIKPVEQWRPTVRPPREGAKRQGVFATRSPYRPNPIGMSVMKYHGWEKRGKKLFIKVSGIDIIDQTPVIDIKPYLPYADTIEGATGGFAQSAPQSCDHIQVTISPNSQQALNKAKQQYPQFEALLRSTLTHNPRPVHFGNIEKRSHFSVQLYQYQIEWLLEDDNIQVIQIKPI